MTSPKSNRGVPLLGVLTICAYGSWYYAFGVLLDPIRTDTNWAESTLTASFSAGTIVVGLMALGGGRLLDRFGQRIVFALGGLLSGAALFTASAANTAGVFFVGAALGLGASGALGFYHVTMTTVVRLNPENADQAIARLTIWGALASAIFLPTTAWLIDDLGWRSTVRILATSVVAAFWLAALLLPNERPTRITRPSLAAVVARAVAPGPPRWLALAIAFGGIAMSTMLVYQVPVMVTAGLPATTAAAMAGFRGLAQLGGRLPLSPLVAKLGADRALILAFGAMALGGGLLVISGHVLIACTFAVIAGFGVGAFSPLQGMRAAQLFDTDDLGATMGFYGAALLLAGSVGPVGAGFLAETTGNRRWVATIVVIASVAAMGSVRQLMQSAPSVSR